MISIRSYYRSLKNRFKYFFRKDLKLGLNVYSENSFFEGKNVIGGNTVFSKSIIGRGSYIGADGHFSNTRIGRYCSIGNRVKVVASIHPARMYVSTHPAFFSLAKQAGFTYAKTQIFTEQKYLDDKNGVLVSIGNDVWIGDEVMILGGVKINDGAIIGSKALVTKDVMAYSIVGGVPAKQIGSRFNEAEIEFLQKFKWWNKEENWIFENWQFFQDIKKFKQEYDKML